MVGQPNRNAVIFDMDGVLVDTEPIYTDINRRLLKRLGVVLPLEQLLSYVGLSARHIWSEIRRDFGLSQSVEDLIQMERYELDRKLVTIAEIPVMPGVITLIEILLDLNFNLGVGSSSPKRLIDRILGKTKLQPYFSVVVSAEEVMHGKPAPDIFIAVSEKLGCVPNCCTVVEDSPHGIRASRLAGMRTIGFQRAHSGSPDLSEADLIISDFSSCSIGKVVRLANPLI